MATVELGINTCFALGRFPEPERWLGLIKDTLALTHVQFSFDMLDPVIIEQDVLERTCRRINELAAAKGLSIDTASTGEIPHKANCLLDPDSAIRRCQMRWYERLIHAAALLGAEASGVYLGSLSQRDHDDPERRSYLLDVLMEELEALTLLAREEGQRYFLWEPMSIPREPPCTIGETRELLVRANRHSHVPIRLCLDVGHGWAHSADPADHDPYAWIREFGSLSPVIHMQQTDGKGSRHWPFTKEFNAIGIITPERIIDAVEQSGADRIQIVFEFFSSAHAGADESVVENLKQSVDYWREALARLYR